VAAAGRNGAIHARSLAGHYPLRTVHRRAIFAVALAAPLLAACGTTTQSSSGDFAGTEKEVADAVGDLQQAASRKQADKICDDLLTRGFAASLQVRGSDCEAEVGKALDDSEDLELVVRDVSVNGAAATARVVRSDGGRPAAFRLENVRGTWRVASFG
jgi:hypothetical protein